MVLTVTSVKTAVFCDVALFSLVKFTDFSYVLTAIIALMMAAARTFETSVNFCCTSQQHIPEDSYLRDEK
jgi:hypothetical protein